MFILSQAFGSVYKSKNLTGIFNLSGFAFGNPYCIKGQVIRLFINNSHNAQRARAQVDGYRNGHIGY
jgi:hypothetical protein